MFEVFKMAFNCMRSTAMDFTVADSITYSIENGIDLDKLAEETARHTTEYLKNERKIENAQYFKMGNKYVIQATDPILNVKGFLGLNKAIQFNLIIGDGIITASHGIGEWVKYLSGSAVTAIIKDVIFAPLTITNIVGVSKQIQLLSDVHNHIERCILSIPDDSDGIEMFLQKNGIFISDIDGQGITKEADSQEPLSERTSVTINADVIVPEGKRLTFKDKIVIVNNTITVNNAELVFDNCEIDTTPLKFNTDKTAIELTAGKLFLLRSDYKKLFPKSEAALCNFSVSADEDSLVSAEKSTFKNIWKFSLGGGRYEFINCQFENPYESFVADCQNVAMRDCTVMNPEKYFLQDIAKLTLKKCDFTRAYTFKPTSPGVYGINLSKYSGVSVIEHGVEEILFDSENGMAEIENCTFDGINGFGNFIGTMRNSTFVNVGKIECHDDGDAEFIDCIFKFSCGTDSHVEFITCPYKVVGCTFTSAEESKTITLYRGLIEARIFSEPMNLR